MVRKIVSGIMSILLVLSMFTLLSCIQPVRASGTIYIRADGSIDPPTAPIYIADDFTYVLMSNIAISADGIVVERDNIVVDGAGYTVQGTGAPDSTGILLGGIRNATIKNMTIETFRYGIELDSSSNSTLSGNNIVATSDAGIALASSSNNTISGNIITTNTEIGILFHFSSNNTISGNYITNNKYGIGIIFSLPGSGNSIFHNNFVENTQQVVRADSQRANIWDDGYPSGGNFWSDYNGIDLYSGPYQNITGSDGVGDTPYFIGLNQSDNYPLMKLYPWAADDIGITSVATSKSVVGQGYNASINVMMFNYGNDTEAFNVTAYANQTIIGEMFNVTLTSGNSTIASFSWNTTAFAYGNYTISAYAETNTANNNLTMGMVTVTIPGDISGDFKVNLVDLVLLANAYGSHPGQAEWNPNADINGNGAVDLADLVILANHYGQHYP